MFAVVGALDVFVFVSITSVGLMFTSRCEKLNFPWSSATSRVMSQKA